MPLSSFARDKTMEDLFSGKLFLSGHTSDPGPVGAAFEAAGLPRQEVSGMFGPVVNGQKAFSGEVFFRKMPKAAITHLVLWDAQQGGNAKWVFPLAEPKQFDSGDTMTVASGDLVAKLK